MPGRYQLQFNSKHNSPDDIASEIISTDWLYHCNATQSNRIRFNVQKSNANIDRIEISKAIRKYFAIPSTYGTEYKIHNV